MKLTLAVDAKTIKGLICDHINAQLGSLAIHPDDVRIEVKSKQNYRAVWEDADIKATNEPKPEVAEFRATVLKV